MLESLPAYIDPGAGSILLQLLIGSVIGAGVFFRHSIASVIRMLRRGKHLPASDPHPPTDDALD